MKECVEMCGYRNMILKYIEMDMKIYANTYVWMFMCTRIDTTMHLYVYVCIYMYASR